MVFIGAPITMALGTIGYWFSDGSNPSLRAWANAFYKSIQLMLMHMESEDNIPLTLELARWMAIVLFGLAAVLTFLRFFRDELRQIRLQIPWPRHVVIVGLSPTALQLARCFHANGQRVVVVAPSATAEGIERYRGKGLTLVTGEIAKRSTLIKARVYRATQVIAASDEDSTNIAIANETRKLIMEKGSRILRKGSVRLFVHLRDIDARTSLQKSHVFDGAHRCEIRFFNFFDAAARKLLFDPAQMQLDHGGIGKDDTRQAHLVILGFGRMGQSVAVRAAQSGHFANRIPLQISVIDRLAERRKQALLFRYPNFEKACKIEFHELEMESLAARQLLGQWCDDPHHVVSVAACFNNDSLGLELALHLKDTLNEHQASLFVRMSEKEGFASVLQNKPEGGNSLPRAFGLVEDCNSDEILENNMNEDLAKAIHASYLSEKTGKDFSTREWDELDEGLKDSNRQQADHIDTKLRALGLERVTSRDPRPPVEQLDEIELLAKMEHCRWNAERWLNDWTMGPRAPEKKTTPFLVPWNDLPDDIRAYDRQTVCKIPEFLSKINQKICRRG